MDILVRFCWCIVMMCAIGVCDTRAQSLQLKGGFNHTTLTGSDHRFRSGFYFGVGKDIPLSAHVSFQPEVFYSLQGSEQGPNLRPTLYRYHYIQMPLYFNFSIGKKAGIVWGPQIGLLARAKIKTDRGETLVFNTFMNPFDLQIGGGPYVKIGDRFKAELRIGVGVIRVAREDDRLRSFGLQGGVAWSIIKPAEE